MKFKYIRDLFLGLPYDIDFDVKVAESSRDECILISYEHHIVQFFLKRSDIILLSEQINGSTE